MIPKKLHYCWFGGNELPPLYKRCIESWSRILPDFQIIRWDESNTPIDTPFLKACQRRKEWAFLSDYARLRAISQHGGVYFDTDIEAVKHLEPLLHHPCFVGLESLGRVNTGVIGSISGHWFPQACMDLIDSRHAKGKSYLIAPEVASLCVDKGESSSLAILSSPHFYPYNPYDKTREVKDLMFSDITPETYAIHHWGKAWSQSIFTRSMKKLGW